MDNEEKLLKELAPICLDIFNNIGVTRAEKENLIKQAFIKRGLHPFLYSVSFHAPYRDLLDAESSGPFILEKIECYIEKLLVDPFHERLAETIKQRILGSEPIAALIEDYRANEYDLEKAREKIVSECVTTLINQNMREYFEK